MAGDDPSFEAHLAGTLDAAWEDFKSGLPWRRRTALFLVVDYYQSAITAAARTVKRELRGGMGLEAMNVVFAAIPDFPPDELRRIEGLRKLRNALDHQPDFIPEERVLLAYLKPAKETRKKLAESAQRARARLDSMGEVPRLFAEIALAIRGLDEGFLPSEENRQSMLNRADEIAATDDPVIGAADLELYAALVSIAQETSDAIDAYYQDMAESQMYDEYKDRGN